MNIYQIVYTISHNSGKKEQNRIFFKTEKEAQDIEQVMMNDPYFVNIDWSGYIPLSECKDVLTVEEFEELFNVNVEDFLKENKNELRKNK